MRVDVRERNGVRLVAPAEPFERVDDALELVSACLGNDALRLLLDAAHLPPAFFDLSTRFAGELLQKLQNYGIRAALVLAPGEERAHGPRFAEFLAEANRGRSFRAFTSRADAEAWLLQDAAPHASGAPLLEGGCLCGAVRYALHGKPGYLGYCHCSMCRRASGSAFGASVPVRVRHVEWLSGRDGITEYESSPGKFRAFCATCGSPLYSRTTAAPDELRIRLGSLDGDPGRRVFAHFWVSARAPWYAITDGLPQYPEGVMTDGDAPAAPIAPKDGA